MTTTSPTCDLCGDPVRDSTAYVCPRCTARTAQQLRAVIALAGEVETTVARLARYSQRGGRRPRPVDDDARRDGGMKATPLPFDPSARKRGDEACNVIVTWARHVAEERGGGPLAPAVMAGPVCRTGLTCRHSSCGVIRDRWVPHPVSRAAEWLSGHLEWLRHRPEAEEAMEELAAAGATLVRIVDAPPPLWYAGPCYAESDGVRCEEELYARADAGTVRCPACDASHEVSARRRWLLDEAEGVLAHAALIAAALSALDRPVTSSSIRNLAHRGRLVERGRDQRGRPLYRVGEVLDVLAEMDARRAVSLAA